jgi:hypothetical protein
MTGQSKLPAAVSPEPPQPLKLTRDKITQREIDEINTRHDRIVRSAAEIAREIIELGELLISVKSRTRHGKWLVFVQKNLRFSARTATRYMRAAEQKYDPILSLDPAEFMARVWGNESKQLEDEEKVKKGKSDVTSDLTEEEDEEDQSQHGGPGFEPEFFPDKGKAACLSFKNFVQVLEEQFLGSNDYTRQAKLDFLNELIRWLGSRRETLSRQGLEDSSDE